MLIVRWPNHILLLITFKDIGVEEVWMDMELVEG